MIGANLILSQTPNHTSKDAVTVASHRSASEPIIKTKTSCANQAIKNCDLLHCIVATRALSFNTLICWA